MSPQVTIYLLTHNTAFASVYEDIIASTDTTTKRWDWYDWLEQSHIWLSEM